MVVGVIPVLVVPARMIETEGGIFLTLPMLAAPDPAVLIEGDRRDLLRFWLGVKVGVPGSNLLNIRLLSRSNRDPAVETVRLGRGRDPGRLVRSCGSRGNGWILDRGWILRDLVATVLVGRTKEECAARREG